VAALVAWTIPTSAAPALGASTTAAAAPASRPAVGYVTLARGNQLDRLDLATGRLLRPFPMRHPATLIAVAPGGTMAYVANYPIGAAVSAVDLSTGRVRAIVRVPNYVDQIAFSRDGKHAYVAMPNAIAVIDTAREQVIKKLPRPPVPSGAWPVRLVVAPHGSTLYVLDGPASKLTEVDTTTNSVRATLPMSVCRFTPPFSPDGRVMYVLTSHGVVPVDTTTGKAGNLVPVGNCLGDLLLGPRGTTLFASTGAITGNQSVSRINVTTGGLNVAWTTPCPLSKYPVSMALSGSTLFVGSSQHPVVRAIGADKGRLGPAIRTGLRLRAGELLVSGRFLFVADPLMSGDGRVGVINPMTMRLVRVIRTGGIPTGLARWPGRPEVLALMSASISSGWLLPISGRTGIASRRIVLGGEPTGIAFAR
jgi:DNA-binding beta-propeller fold protein YncE